jgi:curli production assembly/transport component CsgG
VTLTIIETSGGRTEITVPLSSLQFLMRSLLLILLVAVLPGCAYIHMEVAQEEPVKVTAKQNLWDQLPALDGPPMTVAVYGFRDLTGQNKPNDRLALFSKAVTQGAEVFLIKSLQDSKNYFRVVERVGLDNLIKERQLISNQREVYEGKEAKPLKPLTVAGIILEGGIIGYDSNIRSGGNGARFLGIGGSQQYRVDEVTVSLRLISISSGEVLLTNAVTKTIYSTAHNVGVLRFVDAGTKALELENGAALNEPTTYAVRVAIEQAVYELITEGQRKGLWSYKRPEEKRNDVKPATTNATPATTSGTETKTETAKTETAAVTVMRLREASYIYREPNESSQRTWMLKENTELTVTPGQDGWVAVQDSSRSRGWVKSDRLIQP